MIPMARISNLEDIFLTLESFSPDVRTIFAEAIVELVDSIRTGQRLNGEVANLGQQKLLDLLNLSKKQAADPILYKALKACHTLDTKGVSTFVADLVEPIELVQNYLAVCEKVESSPCVEDIRSIVHATLNDGYAQGCKQLENVVGPELLEAFTISFKSHPHFA
jgi:hypothetical protein